VSGSLKGPDVDVDVNADDVWNLAGRFTDGRFALSTANECRLLDRRPLAVVSVAGVTVLLR